MLEVKVKSPEERVNELVEKLAEIRDTIEALEKQETELKMELVNLMKTMGKKKLYTDNMTVTLKQVTAVKFNINEFKKSHPSIYTQFAKPITYEALYLRRKKKMEEE